MKHLRSLLLLPILVAPVLLLLPTPATAGESVLRAADVTERGRDVDRILDMILVPREPPGAEGRALVFLLDVTPSLQKSDFAGELAAALTRHARVLAGTRIGVGRVGAAGHLLLRPTTRHELVVQIVKEVFAKADSAFQNVYGDVRRILPDLKREKGKREIVLVTLENGDAEDDVEQTVTALERARVRLSVIGREAFLSDALWVLHPPRGPPSTNFTGSDAAFVDIPWGFRFQWCIPNDFVLSGYAMYGLTRLAAATGGKVYLYYPPTGFGHTCCFHRHCTCLFCERDHKPEGEAYRAYRLRALSPLAISRSEVLARAMADPCYRAVQQAWEQASRKGLVYSRPSLEHSAGAIRIRRYPYRGWTPLGTTVAFDSEATRAGRLVQTCDGILRDLDTAIEHAPTETATERYLAIAWTTRLCFQVTRFNLLHFVAWCKEVGPEFATRGPQSYDPPEQAFYGEDAQFKGIGYSNLSLCHGVAPFRQVRFPGGADLARDLRTLRIAWDAYMARWDHTPYAAMVRHLGLTRFALVIRPGYIPPGKRRIRSTASEEAVTLPERPARPGRPGGGSSARPGSGPTSGG